MMDLAEENRKRAEFIEILADLSKDVNIAKDRSAYIKMCNRLEDLYCSKDGSRYRHFYSDIFSFLVHIQDKNTEGNSETLFLNLKKIREEYKPLGESSDISENLKKLYDHISLDLARLGYSNGEGWKASKKETVQNVNAKIEKMNVEINTSEEKIKQIDEKNTEIQQSINEMQKNYIAILGIFAAVLMAFFSGVGFSSSVLANIHQASIYRVILGIMLLGTILFNVIWYILEFIKDLVEKGTREWMAFRVVNGLAIFLIIGVVLIWVCIHFFS